MIENENLQLVSQRAHVNRPHMFALMFLIIDSQCFAPGELMVGHQLYLTKLRTFFSNACPCAVFPPIGQNPLIPRALRAAFVALAYLARPLLANFFFPASDCLRDTTFPCLFRTRSLFFNPPLVFPLVPRNTDDFARFPLAILLTLFAFF